MKEILNGCSQVPKFPLDFFDFSFILFGGVGQLEESGEVIEQVFPHDQAAFICAFICVSICRVSALNFSIST